MKKIILLLFFTSLCFSKSNKAPNFNLTDPYNEKFSLSQFKNKTVILNFFKIYCGGKVAPDTEKQINELKNLCKEFCKGKKCSEGKITIISIVLASCPTTDLKEWVEEKGIKWYIGNDFDDYNLDIIKAYSEYLKDLKDPCLIYINKNGEVFYKSNYTNSKDIKEILKKYGVLKNEKERSN
ncbi:MAG: peroxiredoxin family protein [Candidatus Ratteibacteria bacterium]